MKINAHLSSAALLVVTSCLITTTHAEDEEVTVYGELREENIMTLPNSVSVMNQDIVANREAKHLEDLLNIAPNVNFAMGASRGRFIQIRGIGERSEFLSPINPSVGVIVDGIDMTGIATGVTGLDVNQVEIFRGPQGTLYGANALAGLINVVGNRPGVAKSGSLSWEVGNYSSYHLDGAYNFAITDDASSRIAISQTSSDGYIRNTFLEREDTNNIDEFSARWAVDFDISDTLSIALTTYFIDIDNGYDAFSLDNSRVTLSDQPGHDRQQTFASSVNVEYSGMDFADWHTTMSVADSDLEYGYDEDWSFRNICPIDSDCAFLQYSSTDNYIRDNRNFSMDSRLSSSAGASIEWVLGVYVRDQNIDLDRQRTNNFPDDDPYNLTSVPVVDDKVVNTFDTQNIAAYGEVTIPFSNVLFSVGLREEVRDAELVVNGLNIDDRTEHLWGGKISLGYEYDDKRYVYGLISRGYKAGGFNPELSGIDFSQLPVTEEAILFDTESMLNYELGIKGNWFDNRLQGLVALFFQDRKDIQSNQSFADAVDNFVAYTGNAATGSGYGVEIESTYQIEEGWLIYGNVGFLQAEYDNYNNPSHVDSVDQVGKPLNGRDIAHAPNYQYFIGSHFDFKDNVFLRLEAEGKDSFYFSDSFDHKSESYVLLNMRTGVKHEAWEMAFWMKNITNEEVETRAFFFSNDFGNDPRKNYAPELYTQLGSPRTVGVSGRYHF